jgi:hypothetical protein
LQYPGFLYHVYLVCYCAGLHRGRDFIVSSPDGGRDFIVSSPDGGRDFIVSSHVELLSSVLGRYGAVLID